MNTSDTETNANNARYALGLAASSLHMAQHLHDVESNEERKKKMQRIISMKRDAFKLAMNSCDKAKLGLDPSATHAGAITSWIRQWQMDDRLTLLIDNFFADPFLPYELKYSKKQFKIAWEKLGNAVGVGSISQKIIEDTAANAKKAHCHTPWIRIGLSVAGTAAVLVYTGGLGAPAVLGSAIGSAAGLSGAAATSYGLALLGGGSLAAGGAGMAGGMWLVTSTIAVSGSSLVAISQIAYQLGSQQFQGEVIKLQVNLKTLVAENQLSLAAAQGKISNLREQRQELEKHLNDEKELNESNSQRLKDLEAKIQAITDAIGWLEKEDL